MKTFFYQRLSTCLFSAATLFLGTTFLQSAQATTLTGFSTSGNQMGGMRITVNFFDGTSDTRIWQPIGGAAGGAFGPAWSLTQSGNTYGSFGNPWNFSYVGGSSVAALIIDAFTGNTVFDRFQGTEITRGSADGWDFQTSSGIGPNRSIYSVPIDISQGDLFGRLSLFWDGGFRGNMGFLTDTDSGLTSDPVTPRNPVPALPPPPNVAPTAGIFIPRIQEGQNAIAYLSGTDPNTGHIDFFLNDVYVGTDLTTTGTRSLNPSLGFFADNGTFLHTHKVKDDQGVYSTPVTANLIVDNVAPTLTQFDLSAYTINEGESVSAFLSSEDPGADYIDFFLNDIDFPLSDGYIGTNLNTFGERTLSHNLGTFFDEGEFSYKAISKDKDAAYSNEIVRNLTVLNVAPTIVSLTSDLEVDQEETFMFDALATDPGINDILTYMWDLDGDGNYNDFVGTSGNWSFADAGIQTIGLKVTDGDGGEAFSSFNVTVNPEPEPEPSPTPEPEPSPTPEPEPEPSPKQVPEPSSIIGLLTLSIGGFLLKRKKDN